jgi:hypothetical protein
MQTWQHLCFWQTMETQFVPDHNSKHSSDETLPKHLFAVMNKLPTTPLTIARTRTHTHTHIHTNNNYCFIVPREFQLLEVSVFFCAQNLKISTYFTSVVMFVPSLNGVASNYVEAVSAVDLRELRTLKQFFIKVGNAANSQTNILLDSTVICLPARRFTCSAHLCVILYYCR